MKYHRESIRLDGFDYSENGYYFVTVCTQDKLKLFWKNEIIDNWADMVRIDKLIRAVRPYIKSEYVNEIGLMIDYWFGEISNHFKNVILDEYIIMPDHVHFILIIKYSPKIVGVDRCVDPKTRKYNSMV